MSHWPCRFLWVVLSFLAEMFSRDSCEVLRVAICQLITSYESYSILYISAMFLDRPSLLSGNTEEDICSRNEKTQAR